MKVIFLGTPDFAVPCLDALAQAGHEVQLVVTQPDKPKGRGKQLAAPPVKVAAEALGMKVLQPDVLLPEIISDDCDAGIVIAFGKILKPGFFQKPKHGFINVHASLLPKYRGAAPITAAIKDGESVTGVTTMQVAKGLDTGDMLLRKSCEISARDTAGSMHDKLSELGAELLIETLREMQEGALEHEVQDDAKSCYAPMLKKSDGCIIWDKDSRAVDCHVRAMTPWPSAFTFAGKKRLKILEGAPHIRVDGEDEPGTVLALEGEALLIRCKEGAYAIARAQPEGRNSMSGADLVKGRYVEVGECLSAVNSE